MFLYEHSFIQHIKSDNCESMKLVVVYMCGYYLIFMYIIYIYIYIYIQIHIDRYRHRYRYRYRYRQIDRQIDRQLKQKKYQSGNEEVQKTISIFILIITKNPKPILFFAPSQLTFTCSKSNIEILEKCVIYVQI